MLCVIFGACICCYDYEEINLIGLANALHRQGLSTTVVCLSFMYPGISFENWHWQKNIIPVHCMFVFFSLTTMHIKL